MVQQQSTLRWYSCLSFFPSRPSPGVNHFYHVRGVMWKGVTFELMNSFRLRNGKYVCLEFCSICTWSFLCLLGNLHPSLRSGSCRENLQHLASGSAAKALVHIAFVLRLLLSPAARVFRLPLRDLYTKHSYIPTVNTHTHTTPDGKKEKKKGACTINRQKKKMI